MDSPLDSRSDPITLSGIYIYPVKSLRGIALPEAELVEGRIPGDRQWVVVDENGAFLHQRDHPQMARVEAMPIPMGIRLRSNGLPPIEVPAPCPSSERGAEEVLLWRRRVPVLHADRRADAWLSAALDLPCRLMWFAPRGPAPETPETERASALHDATPFHLVSESSLADLNRHTRAPVPIDRFRPTLAIRGAEPYLEDHARSMAIGENLFRWVRPCSRCAMTVTDQETGERTSPEPLATLAHYRRDGQAVFFGHYLVAERWSGALRVGDRVELFE